MPHRSVTREEFERITGRMQATIGVLQKLTEKQWTTGQKLVIVQQVVQRLHLGNRAANEKHGILTALDELLHLPDGTASKMVQQQ